jgi:gluconate 2-dehydrogenase gamma chain
MSEPVDYSRRELLRHIGLSLTLGAAATVTLSAQDAAQVHEAVRQEKSATGGYKPKGLTPHEFATLQRLSDLIIPADEHSPGALEAGAAEYIDFLCSASDEMQRIYTGGIGWLDDEVRRHDQGHDFLSAPAEKQTALLDRISFREAAGADEAPGVEFFAWARKMVVDGYYTSPVGIKDLGYMGNRALSHFSVPAEAIEYALKRSPLG